jgi:hypothetical protein
MIVAAACGDPRERVGCWNRSGTQLRQGVGRGCPRRARGQADGFYEVAGHAGRRERARAGAQAHETLSRGDQSRRERQPDLE